jgi:hypothetical protein
MSCYFLKIVSKVYYKKLFKNKKSYLNVVACICCS